MFLWSKLSGSQWLDAWEERFNGFPNLVIEVIKGGKSIRLKLFCESRKEAQSVVERFGGSVREVTKAEWTKPVPLPRPVKARDSLLVTPAAGTKELAALRAAHPRREIISIPPEMAFGTGDHATTATCLRLLVDVSKERRGTAWSAADLGTGTGLLAIAARKLGSGPVFACDFDPFAVEVARDNLRRNGIDGVTLKEQDVLKWNPRKSGYQVVLANLFSTVLIEAWPVIARALAPGGDLIVSGILASQAWEVFTAAAGHGLGFDQVVRKGKWVTARGKHLDDLIAAQG
jgi:ribosomal protein L11 methyltransferase